MVGGAGTGLGSGEVFVMPGVLVDERPIRERWLIVREELDERGRRMWAAAEARSHGRGGIAAVVRATAISEATVRRGIAEVSSGQRAPEGRVRRAGAGRPGIEEREPGLREALLGVDRGRDARRSRCRRCGGRAAASRS